MSYRRAPTRHIGTVSHYTDNGYLVEGDVFLEEVKPDKFVLTVEPIDECSVTTYKILHSKAYDKYEKEIRHLDITYAYEL